MSSIIINLKNIQMKLFDHTGSATKEFFLEKGVEALLILSDVPVSAMATEKIELIVDRNDRNNTNITPSKILLKRYIVLSTYGTDAITSFQDGVDGEFETVALCELCEDGALHLAGNDKLKITLTGLDPLKNYSIYGIESPNVSDDPFVFEEKNIQSSTTNVDINTESFDMMVVDSIATLESLEFHYKNGRNCTYTQTELRAIAQDIDPVAYVKKDGTVSSNFVGIIQMPLIHVETITVKKSNAAELNFTFRRDNDIDENQG